MKTNILSIALLISLLLSLGFKNQRNGAYEQRITTGAERMEVIKSLLGEKKVGLVVNHTATVGNGVHLLDTLLAAGVRVTKIFAPEHGFRGNEDAGKHISNSRDSKTGLPIVSLYGKNRKPDAALLEDVDVLLFDIQDVGTRFYTYISTMHYAMEAAAEHDREFVVLDRPNPNDYVDGPMLEQGFKSFVGVDPIPVLHGLTVGELAQMINGEGWIKTGANSCRLTVVEALYWRHGFPYVPPVKPSPNLPDYKSIRLYPSLCFFEGTSISVARGTKFPFKALGYPDPRYGDFVFTPRSLPGFDANPMYKEQKCYGVDLRQQYFSGGLSLQFLLDFYERSGRNEKAFFSRSAHFDLLAGTDKLRKQIAEGLTEEQIRATWEDELNEYRKLRSKYLIYKDYE